jgi:type II secretory pathway pseudopilin PulG
MEQAQARHGESGYAMVALLVALALMAVMMSVALPVWRQASQREKEAELVWRGEQYDRAIQLFRRKFSAPGPPNLDILIQQKFLRRKYTDPITGGDFELKTTGPMGNLPPGAQQPQRAPGQLIGGVRSKSKEKSIRVLNGKNRYDQWEFTYKPYGAKTAGPTVPGQAPGTQPGSLPGNTRPLPGTLPSSSKPIERN